MVKVRESEEYERLEQLVLECARRHGFSVQIEGWTRKTYDVFRVNEAAKEAERVARIESFATTSGEIRVFDEAALDFAQDLGAHMEESFSIPEAVIIRQPPPRA